MHTEVLEVRGLMSDHDADTMTAALRSIPGVNDVTVSIENGSATVKFDDNLTSRQELQTMLARVGYAIRKVALDDSCGGGCCGGCGGS